MKTDKGMSCNTAKANNNTCMLDGIICIQKPCSRNTNLFSLAGLEGKMTSVIGDIRNFAALKAAFDAAQPEIVLHLAAQPIVRDSYKDPRYTYETNVMGTVNLYRPNSAALCAERNNG